MATIDSHGLPSPLASTGSPAPSLGASITGQSVLPAQRHHPLRPGSSKEIALINYVDDKILAITRRYSTKFTNIKTKNNEAPGYTSLDQIVDDINPLIDLVWSTGTATLQISYLLTLAGFVASYMPAFPFSTQLFRIVKRFDAAFSTLLRGMQRGNGPRSTVSMTEKVRIKAVVEETRVNAVNTATSGGHSARIEDLSDQEEDEEMNSDRMELDTEDDSNDDIENQPIALAISKLYKSAIELLGDDLSV